MNVEESCPFLDVLWIQCVVQAQQLLLPIHYDAVLPHVRHSSQLESNEIGRSECARNDNVAIYVRHCST